VILNLVVNARDAMPGGGRLTIRTENVTVDDAGATAHAGLTPGAHARLSVTDTGHGMTPEVQAHLFEPFFTTKGPGRGTGLGLATVYGIVRQAGGAVGAESEPGRGATFSIWLPRSDRPVPVLPPPPAPTPQRGSERVLVVEDDPSVRVLTVRLLRDAGYTVSAAARGDEAIEIAQRDDQTFDLLLTDVVMPGMSGLALSESLLARDPNLRVLFVSGYTQDAIDLAGAAEGSVGFLAKPYAPARLLARIRELLDAPARA
jgi:CheY-like chemotaxis protein